MFHIFFFFCLKRQYWWKRYFFNNHLRGSRVRAGDSLSLLVIKISVSRLARSRLSCPLEIPLQILMSRADGVPEEDTNLYSRNRWSDRWEGQRPGWTRSAPYEVHRGVENTTFPNGPREVVQYTGKSYVAKREFVVPLTPIADDVQHCLIWVPLVLVWVA